MTALGAILKILADNWRAIAVAVLVVTVFEIGDVHGRATVKAKWDAAKLVEQQAEIAAEQSARGTENADNKATNEVSNDYQTNLAAIDNRYGAALAGVRGQTAAPSNLPGLSDCLTGHNDATCAHRLSNTDKTVVIGVAKDAENQTRRLLACQKLIKRWVAVQNAANQPNTR